MACQRRIGFEGKNGKGRKGLGDQTPTMNEITSTHQAISLKLMCMVVYALRMAYVCICFKFEQKQLYGMLMFVSSNLVLPA